MAEKAKSGELKAINTDAGKQPPAKRRRWDVETPKQEPPSTPTLLSEPVLPSTRPKKRLGWDAAEVSDYILTLLIGLIHTHDVLHSSPDS